MFRSATVSRTLLSRITNLMRYPHMTLKQQTPTATTSGISAPGAVQLRPNPSSTLLSTRSSKIDKLGQEDWDAIRGHVSQGGKKIIELRGRSSFQSPAHQSLVMIGSVMSGEEYPWPVGCYVHGEGYEHIMMAMETTLGADGVSWKKPAGTDQELAELDESYSHLTKLRDEVIEMGVLPPLDQWNQVNPNLG